MQGVNDLSQGFFSILLLFSVFIIIFIMYSGHDTKSVLVADCFVVTILAMILWALDFIGIAYVLICVGGLFGAFLARIFLKEG